MIVFYIEEYRSSQNNCVNYFLTHKADDMGTRQHKMVESGTNLATAQLFLSSPGPRFLITVDLRGYRVIQTVEHLLQKHHSFLWRDMDSTCSTGCVRIAFSPAWIKLKTVMLCRSAPRCAPQSQPTSPLRSCHERAAVAKHLLRREQISGGKRSLNAVECFSKSDSMNTV